LQEYFFKSQESLATVIDFVEEEIDVDNIHKVVNHQNAASSSSTQSSPREPASRRKVPQVIRRLTP